MAVPYIGPESFIHAPPLVRGAPTPWHLTFAKVRTSGGIKKRKAKQFARAHGRRMKRGR